MYAYQLPRPDHYRNVREAASENYRGLTAVINDKPYLVVDREKVEYVLEDEEGNKLWVEHFDHTARNEHDALIAATRVQEPFLPGNKIGDWTIGNLAYHEGNWHVRNGDTDQIVPITELVSMLEDESYFKDNFNSNFNVQLTSAEKRAQRIAALRKIAMTIETNLPVNGWHNGAIALAQQLGVQGTITYPGGETVGLTDFKNFMLTMKYAMSAPGGPDQLNAIPIIVETDTPDSFWEVWEDTARRGGGGGNRERGLPAPTHTPIWYGEQDKMPPFAKLPEREELPGGVRPTWNPGNRIGLTLPDTPAQHFLDTMEVTADRKDYEHWNEDADRMWWEEEGKHEDYQEPYDDYNDRADVAAEALAEAGDEGYMYATEDMVPPDAVDVPYRDSEAQREFLKGYNQGRLDMGLDVLTQDEMDQLLGEGKWTGYNQASWTRVAEGEIVPGPGGTPQDIPFDPATQQSIVHAYEDGDIILEDGTTTFDPERAYQFLIGAHEFDKAKQVKELIDRSPPSELPAAVIPPDQAMQPQEKLPEEAPLDPTGGQPQPATGAPMQPGAEVPAPPAGVAPGQPPRPRASVEFHESKEARKDFTHSEQKALINENLEGRARNYDKLNLKGTHYELEQESSFDDFLWQ